MSQKHAMPAESATNVMNDAVTAHSSTKRHVQEQVSTVEGELLRPSPRTFCVMRFVFGLLLTTLGIGIVLTVGLSLIHVRQFGNETALPVVGLSVLSGVMLLGGGFGLMATAAAGTTSPSNVMFDGEAAADCGPREFPDRPCPDNENARSPTITGSLTEAT